MNNNTTLPLPPDTIILPDNVLADIYNNDNDEYQDMIDYEIWNSRVIEDIRRKMKQ